MRDAGLAMKSFRSVVKKDYDYFATMSSMVTYIFRLYTIKRLIECGLSEEKVFMHTGERNRFGFNTKLKGSQNYTKKELYSALKKLSKIDVLLKSSSINKLALFDDFFLSLDRKGGTNFS